MGLTLACAWSEGLAHPGINTIEFSAGLRRFKGSGGEQAPSIKHHGFSSVWEDAMQQMPSNRARQYLSLQLAAFAH